MYDLDGVIQVQDAHFWTLCSGVYLGSLRLEVIPETDTRRVLTAARSILLQVGTFTVVSSLVKLYIALSCMVERGSGRIFRPAVLFIALCAEIPLSINVRVLYNEVRFDISLHAHTGWTGTSDD